MNSRRIRHANDRPNVSRILDTIQNHEEGGFPLRVRDIKHIEQRERAKGGYQRGDSLMTFLKKTVKKGTLFDRNRDIAPGSFFFYRCHSLPSSRREKNSEDLPAGSDRLEEGIDTANPFFSRP